MATILFTWELGGGQGHLAPHRELLNAIARRGHSVHVASRDLLRAGRVFAGIPVTYWQSPLSFQQPERLFQPTLSLAHILHNVGYANPRDLAVRFSAWRNLFAAIRPAVILADYSPTAILASRGGPARTITVGIGFCLPPARKPLPAFATLRHVAGGEHLAEDESRVVGNINLALAKHRLPVITALAEAFHATNAQWLTTLPELDHYSDRGTADYWGLPPERSGQPATWPSGSRRRVFGYLKPFPALETMLALLNRLELPTIIACDGLPSTLRERHASASLKFAPSNVDLGQMTRECHLAITNANHTTTARFLLAGKPVLMAPLQLEQDLIATTVSQQGLGVSIRPRDPRDVFDQLGKLLNTATYHDAASTLSAKYASFHEDRLQRMIASVEYLAAN